VAPPRRRPEGRTGVSIGRRGAQLPGREAPGRSGQAPGFFVREIAWGAVGGNQVSPIIGGGPSGALTLIQRQTLAAPSGQVIFSSIPATYAHLLLTATCRSAHNVGGADLLQLRFNNDAVTNNYSQDVHGNAATAAGTESIGGTIMNLGAVVNDTDADTSHATHAQIFVPDYTGTVWYKNVIAEVFTPIGSLTTNLTKYDAGGFWKSSGAVTRVDLFLGGGFNYKTGSIFALYGVS